MIRIKLLKVNSQRILKELEIGKNQNNYIVQAKIKRVNLLEKENNIEMASAEGTDSIEVESVFSSKNRDIHSSTLKSTSGTEDGKQIHFHISCISRKKSVQNTKSNIHQPSLMNSIGYIIS